MKLKRLLLIIVLIIFTAVCMYTMNTKFDRLARYQYVTDENRDLIEAYMSDEDIAYMVQQKIKPSQFEPFITKNGFTVKNTLYYDKCNQVMSNDPQYIVNFVNAYKDNFKFADIEPLLNNYGYAVLEAFYNGSYQYFEDAQLIADPSLLDVEISENQTLYTYVPKNLVSINYQVIPSLTKNDGQTIMMRSELVNPLTSLCKDAKDKTDKVCGGLILSDGYVSYEEQVHDYDAALLAHGLEKVSEYATYPGQNPRQMGYMITLTLSQLSTHEEMMESETMKWLQSHAQLYGFEIYHISDKDEDLKKFVTLRYIGMPKKENTKEAA